MNQLLMTAAFLISFGVNAQQITDTTLPRVSNTFTQEELESGDKSPEEAQKIYSNRMILYIKSYESIFLAKRNLKLSQSPFRALEKKVLDAPNMAIKNLSSVNLSRHYQRMFTMLFMVNVVYDSIDSIVLGSTEFNKLKAAVTNATANATATTTATDSSAKPKKYFTREKIMDLGVLFIFNLIIFFGLRWFMD